MKSIFAVVISILVFSIVNAATRLPTGTTIAADGEGPFPLQNSGRHCCSYKPVTKTVYQVRTFIERESYLFTWTDVTGTKPCWRRPSTANKLFADVDGRSDYREDDTLTKRINPIIPGPFKCPITVTRSSTNYRTKQVKREIPMETPGRCDEDSIVCCKDYVEWTPSWATEPECVEAEYADYLKSSGM